MKKNGHIIPQHEPREGNGAEAVCEAGVPLSCLRQLDWWGLAARPETQLEVELLLSLTSKTHQQALSPL